MAGPLSGIGSGQQAPITQTFQPGRNVDNSQQEEQVRQSNGGVAAVSEGDNQQAVAVASASDSNGTQDFSASTSGRGGTIDILV